MAAMMLMPIVWWNPSHRLLLTVVTIQGLISMQGAFGADGVDMSLRKSVNMIMEIVHAILNVNLSSHLLFPLLVAWEKKLLFSTTILSILYPSSMVSPTTRHSPGCVDSVMPSHFLYYVLLCWLFERAESCSHQSTLLSPLNCQWQRKVWKVGGRGAEYSYCGTCTVKCMLSFYRGVWGQ